MQILQRFSNDLEEALGLLLFKPVLLLGKEIVVEGIGSTVFLDQVYFCTALNYIDKFGNDWMVEFREDVDFSFEIFKLVGLIQSLLFVYLYCYFLVCALTDAHLYNTVSTLA